MIEIPFWQSAAAGAVLAASITALSSWFQRRRDDRLESRRTRREAGTEGIRSAFRAREAASHVVARMALGQKDKVDLAMTAWLDAWAHTGEQIVTTRALAAPMVSAVLDEISGACAAWVLAQQAEPGVQRTMNSQDQLRIDALLTKLTVIVRRDAKTDLGASVFERLRRSSL
jgi:hypothetical protein